MTDDILALLRMHEYFNGLDDDILLEIAELAEVRRYESSQCVHRANEMVTTIGFVAQGRLKAVHVDPEGTERLFRFLERGDQMGMISAALTEPLPISVIAVEPTTLVLVDYDSSLDLTTKHPELRLWNVTPPA